LAQHIALHGQGLSGIDAKGRVTLPAELRAKIEASSEGRTLCVGRHATKNCLYAYGTAERDKFLADIDRQWDAAVARGEAFDREAAGAELGSLFEIGFEASGRFVMPPVLRHFGGLGDRAWFHGTGGRILIWNPDSFLADTDPGFAQQREMCSWFLAEAEKRAR
jgi:MraZ protein